MTNITIHNKTEVKAQGKHTNKNSKPVLCINTGEIFVSVLDAAEKAGVTASSMSRAVTGSRGKITCKGKRYCFISDVMSHLDEISHHINEREEKANAWDAKIAEEKAAREAEEARQREMSLTEALITKLEEKMSKLRTEQNNNAKLLYEAKNKLTMLKAEALA